MSKLTNNTLSTIKRGLVMGLSGEDIAHLTGASTRTVTRVKTGDHYTDETFDDLNGNAVLSFSEAFAIMNMDASNEKKAKKFNVSMRTVTRCNTGEHTALAA